LRRHDRRDKPVPTLRHGLDKPGRGGIVVQYRSELGDTHVQVSVEFDDRVAAPDFSLDFLASQDLARMLHQILKEFSCCGVNLMSTPARRSSPTRRSSSKLPKRRTPAPLSVGGTFQYKSSKPFSHLNNAPQDIEKPADPN